MKVKVITKSKMAQEPIIIKQAQEDDYLVTVKEASKRLSTTVHYVYKLMDSGLLVGMKLGALKVSNSELNRFIKEMKGKDVNSMIGGDTVER